MKKELMKEIEKLQERVEQIEILEQIGLPKYLTEVNLNLLNCLSKYSMGEIFTLSFKNDILLKKDNRKEYKGRGQKYNRNIKYGNIIVNIKTKKDLANLLLNLNVCLTTQHPHIYMQAHDIMCEIIKKYSTKDEITHFFVQGE